MSLLRFPTRQSAVLTELDDCRGAKLLREASDALEVETYSGTSVEGALLHVLAYVAQAVYLEPSSASHDQLARTNGAAGRGCPGHACSRHRSRSHDRHAHSEQSISRS
jgi:hypothetical protein